MQETESGNVQPGETIPLPVGGGAPQPLPSARENRRLLRAAGQFCRNLVAIPIALCRHPGRTAIILVLLLVILGGFGLTGAYLWAS